MAAVAILWSSTCCELFFFFIREFQLMASALNDSHQTKTSISFFM